jgi:hypothetical protein
VGRAQGLAGGDLKKLAKVFGVPGPVLVGKIYGDIADGTAACWTQPAGHPPLGALQPRRRRRGRRLVPEDAAGRGSPLPPADQIWLWKDIGTADRLRRPDLPAPRRPSTCC